MLGDLLVSTIGLSASLSVVTRYLGTRMNFSRLRNRHRRVFGLLLLAEVQSLQRLFRRYYNVLNGDVDSGVRCEWPRLHFDKLVRRLLLIGLLLIGLILSPATAEAQPTQSAPDTIAARLLACAACHGTQGQGTDNDYFPRLAGKPAGYLMNQLVAFRDGRRRYPPMNYLLQYLPDAYLQQMADHFAALRPAPVAQAVADASTAVLDRGRSIVAGGDPARGVPACSRCHGTALTGMEPAIPGLVGLHASYISAQLGAWRYGTRTAAAPDCMQIVAASLTESDVTAVAAWLSSVPIPTDPSPVPHGSLPMPLACGSEPG